MNIRQQRNLYKIIKELGVEQTEYLLHSFIEDDDFELYFEDEQSLLFMAFSGWFNNKVLQDENDTNETIVKGFIQYNLDKGSKNFEKKRRFEITDDFREKWKAKFGSYPKE